MVWTSGRWVVRDGLEEDFTVAWGEFARWSVEEFPGGRAWLLRDRDDPSVFVSVGPWPDDDVIQMWRNSLGFRERIGHLRDLIESFVPETLDEVFAVS
jgi:hypothetical protein